MVSNYRSPAKCPRGLHGGACRNISSRMSFVLVPWNTPVVIVGPPRVKAAFAILLLLLRRIVQHGTQFVERRAGKCLGWNVQDAGTCRAMPCVPPVKLTAPLIVTSYSAVPRAILKIRLTAVAFAAKPSIDETTASVSAP